MSLVCPSCGSVDILLLRSNRYICQKCEHIFSPKPDEYTGITDHPMNIFISYAHSRHEIVNEIQERLKERGHTIWFDQSNIEHGDDWREKITKGINESNGVLSFLSKDAIKDEAVCLDELGIAVGVKYGNILTVLLQKENDLIPIPAQLTRRQWLDMSGWEEIRARDRDEYQKWLDQMIKKIIGMIESPKVREFEGEIKQIRKFLKIDDTTISPQKWYLKQSFTGREWLNEQIEDWLKNQNGGHLCAVYGGPGTGKSAFAAHYVYRSFRTAASLFFEHGNDYFNSPDTVLRELIFQLACRLPQYRERLILELSRLNNPGKLNIKEKYERLAAVPLQESVDANHETLCVVIDGLDECDEKEQKEIAELLNEKRFPKWLRILILSRPEINIIGNLSPNRIINLNDTHEENLKDIRKYFEQRLEKPLLDHSEKEALLDKLVKNSDGVFLYAYIVSDMIIHGNLSLNEPDAFPKNLNETFEKLFRRYFPNKREFDRFYKLTLGIIASSHHPVPVRELEIADGYYDRPNGKYRLRRKNPNERVKSIEERLDRCALLLKYGTNIYGEKTVNFNHRYISEWYVSKDESTGQSSSSDYCCRPSDAMWILETAWRKHIEEKQFLSDFQLLHQLSAMRLANEEDNLILQTVSCSHFLKSLEERQSKYISKIKIDLILPFAQASYELYSYILGEKADITLDLLSQWGMFLVTAGRNDEALEKYSQVYKEQKEISGENDPKTINALSNIAIPLLDMGKQQEALDIRQAVYETRKQVLGPDHPDTIKAMNELADSWIRTGNLPKAMEIHEKIYEIRKQSQGLTHPDTLNALYDLRNSDSLSEKYRETLDALEKEYETIRKDYGDDHPDTLAVLHRLAATYDRSGRFEEALEKFERYHEFQRNLHGDSHRNTLKTLMDIGLILCKLEKYEEALTKLEQAYETSKITYGIDDLLTVELQGFLLKPMFMVSDPLTALSKAEEIITTLEAFFGKNNSFAQAFYYIQSVMLSKLGRYSEAIDKAEKAYKLRKRTHGDQDSQTIAALKVMIEAHIKLKEYQQAAELQEQLYKTYSSISNQTLTELSRLALLNLEAGDNKKAVENLQIIYKTLKANGIDYQQNVLIYIALLYGKMNRFEEAIEAIREVYNIRKDSLGEEHPSTMEVFEIWNNLTAAQTKAQENETDQN